jgi:hypothetical protein
VLDRTNELQEWWSSLDVDARVHAFVCVENGRGDAWLTQSLRSVGIAVVVDVSHGLDAPSMPHIPRDVATFVAAQPHGRSASGRLLMRGDPAPG